MRCGRCGQLNAETSAFCAICGNVLDARTTPEAVASIPPAGPLPGFKKTSLILVAVLSFVTFGIYYPVWFLRRREAFNNLEAREKLGSGVFVAVIVLFGVSLLLGLASGLVGGFGQSLARRDLQEAATALDLCSQVLTLVVLIVLWVQCFKARRILTEHLRVHAPRELPVSALSTFVLQIFYLQLKINRVLTPPSG